MGLFLRLVKIPVSIFSIILAIYHWQKSKHVLKLFDQQLRTCLGFLYVGLIIEKIENRIISKIEQKSPVEGSDTVDHIAFKIASLFTLDLC